MYSSLNSAIEQKLVRSPTSLWRIPGVGRNLEVALAKKESLFQRSETAGKYRHPRNRPLEVSHRQFPPALPRPRDKMLIASFSYCYIKFNLFRIGLILFLGFHLQLVIDISLASNLASLRGRLLLSPARYRRVRAA